MNSVVGIIESNKKIRDLIQCYLNMQHELSCPIAVESIKTMLEYLEEHQKPDIILVDIELHDMSGFKGIGLIKNRCPEIEIIMLTVYHNPHNIFNALRAGASGYLLKHTPLPEIKEFIIKLVEGCAAMSPQVARKVMNHFQKNGPKQNSASNLTPREYDIVNGLVNGLSCRMIANRYDISIDTVGAHIHDIYQKLRSNAIED